ETALLMALYVIQGSAPDGPSDEELESWRSKARDHQRWLLEVRRALELIEQEYFDGTAIVFRGSWALLQENIKELSEFLEPFDDRLAWARAEAAKLGDEDDSKQFRAHLERLAEFGRLAPDAHEGGARRQATAWVNLVRAMVLDEFGETGRAKQILADM